jgi:transposase
VEGLDRRQSFLLPERIQNYVGEDNPVRVIDVFIDRTDLSALGFGRVVPADTSRAGHHPATLLKLYLYGYLNRIASSAKVEAAIRARLAFRDGMKKVAKAVGVRNGAVSRIKAAMAA